MEWLSAKFGRPGCPSVFSDAAIQFCLMVKVLFGLPLRQKHGHDVQHLGDGRA